MDNSCPIAKLLGVNSFGQKPILSDSDLDVYESKLRKTQMDSTNSAIAPPKESQLSLRSTVGSTLSEEDIPPPPASKILSTVNAPEGGKISTVRNADGRLQMRIEYSREQMRKCAQSPISILPPASIKDMVMEMPEILAPFPVRHGFSE